MNKVGRLLHHQLRSIATTIRNTLTRSLLVTSAERIYIARTVIFAVHWRTCLQTITLGSGVYIGDYSVVNVSTDGKTAGISPELRIGEMTYIGQMNNIRAAGGTIIIGSRCLISQMVTMVASNHGLSLSGPIQDQPWDAVSTGIRIGDDVWIGAGAVILPGVTIGRGAVVAANAVVCDDIGEYEIVAGVPARKIRDRL